MPQLERVLGRASRGHANGSCLDARLLDRFGFGGCSPPVSIAAVSYRADFDIGAQGNWLRADPVYLRVDQGSAVLFSGLDLDADEVTQLATAFNDLFGPDGFELHTTPHERWYLRAPGDEYPDTPPLHEVIGRDINFHLPEGEGARSWRQLLNEAQMLFHTHPVNMARERNGKVPVNSLWLWGGGSQPGKCEMDFDVIYSDEVVGRGLGHCAGIPVEETPRNARNWLQQAPVENALAVIDELQSIILAGELYHWPHAVADIEKDWIEPLQAAVRNGELERLVIDPCQGEVFEFGRKQARRFWRRPATLRGLHT